MQIKALILLVCVLGVSGCATTPIAPLPAHLLWQDKQFDYHASAVTVTKQDLFALDTDLLAALRLSRAEKSTNQARVDHLISLLYRTKNTAALTEFPYEAGHSTVAAETWRRRRGDCLSLVVLSYSMAKALDLVVSMQQVRVPYSFDRHGGIDYVASHVNLRITNGRRAQFGEPNAERDITIDFQPQIGSWREGWSLTEDAILARFYNNLAAEYLAKGQLNPAYAHFKAAIETDPGFAPSYANLALVYKRQGLMQSAERMLLHAIALDDDDDVPMHTLHQLLVSQGRDAEAMTYAKLLEAKREKNPYYWIGLGLDQLQKTHYPQAIHALEKAEALSTGFIEVHRYLAIAYFQNGNQAEAKKQASLLAALAKGNSVDAALSSKLKRLPLN